MATEFAPAKINLALHVTAQRGDGYHLLDSLVVFANVGDRITVAAADGLSLAVTGPMAAGLTLGDDNLVLRAARSFGVAPGAAISLEKNLPVAAGIGGGSSDAAAVLALGADVPVCLAGRPARMTGIGAGLVPVGLPAAWLVLVNPGVALPTAAVFAGQERHDHPAMPRDLPQFQGVADLAAFLRLARNDLEAPAIRLAPVIARCTASLAAMSGCLLARMSGSGATCFGLFANSLTAHAAARALQAAQPGWWLAAARMLD